MESSGAQRHGETASSSGSASHVLFVLQQTKADLEKEMKAGFEALTALVQGLSDRVDAETRTTREILQGLPERGSFLECEQVRPAESSARNKSASEIRLLRQVAHKEKSMTCVLQWFCLSTVVSFAKAHAAVRSWVQPNVCEKLMENLSAIGGASGLSCLFFSVTNKDGKDKYQSDIGKLWTFIIRSAMVSIILHVKQVSSMSRPESTSRDAQRIERELPAWLSSFGNSRKIVASVNAFMDKAEYKAVISSSECSGDGERVTRKRRRLQGDDEHAETRRAALQVLRKSIMRWITIGRTELRALLFAKLLFVIEKIESFESVEAARTEGFEVIFPDVSEKEEIASANEAGSIWEVPNAKVRNMKESSERRSNVDETPLFAENEKHLRALQEQFQSLTVTVKYNRRVERDVHALESQGRMDDMSDEQILWPIEESISLHKIATGCLMEAFGCKDASVVLSSSPFSLKTIHILAIGIRGLLKQSLSLELTVVETSCLGRLTHKRVQKGDTKASTMLGTDESTKKRRKKDIRGQKLSMPWSDYVVEKEKAEEERRRREERISESEHSDEDDFDDALGWIDFAHCTDI